MRRRALCSSFSGAEWPCAAHLNQAAPAPRAVTVAAGRDTFGHYRHEAAPAGEMDAAALEQHAAAVQMVYPAGFERSGGN